MRNKFVMNPLYSAVGPSFLIAYFMTSRKRLLLLSAYLESYYLALSTSCGYAIADDTTILYISVIKCFLTFCKDGA